MIGAVHEHSATWAEGPRKFEAGTRNVGGEVGFAAALDYIDHIGWQTMMDHEPPCWSGCSRAWPICRG